MAAIEINAENFEELGQSKFNIRHKEIVDGNTIENIENNFRFLIDIDGEEVVIFTQFEENFLPFIQELTNVEPTYHPEEVEKKEEIEEMLLIAVEAFAALAALSSAPVTGSNVASNVFATIAENAAITRSSVRYAKGVAY